jgi:tetratricopeptide (TPR) repeat protein
MRFVERLIRTSCLAAASAALAACALFDDKPTTSQSPSPGVGAPSDVKAGAPGAAAKGVVAAPAIAKPESPISPNVQRAFDTARQALAAGQTAEAERGFVALTKSNPELAGPYANLGLIHRQAGKSAESVAALEKAVQLSPQRADLHNQLGITYRTAGDFAKAKASYERSISLDSAYAPAMLNLGILYDLYLWDGVRALELYDRYLQLTPGGDEQVQRWISDLRNRSLQKNAPQRKEQG